MGCVRYVSGHNCNVSRAHANVAGHICYADRCTANVGDRISDLLDLIITGDDGHEYGPAQLLQLLLAPDLPHTRQ